VPRKFNVFGIDRFAPKNGPSFAREKLGPLKVSQVYTWPDLPPPGRLLRVDQEEEKTTRKLGLQKARHKASRSA
jgi:hypothetical protein